MLVWQRKLLCCYFVTAVALLKEEIIKVVLSSAEGDLEHFVLSFGLLNLVFQELFVLF